MAGKKPDANELIAKMKGNWWKEAKLKKIGRTVEVEEDRPQAVFPDMFTRQEMVGLPGNIYRLDNRILKIWTVKNDVHPAAIIAIVDRRKAHFSKGTGGENVIPPNLRYLYQTVSPDKNNRLSKPTRFNCSLHVIQRNEFDANQSIGTLSPSDMEKIQEKAVRIIREEQLKKRGPNE